MKYKSFDKPHFQTLFSEKFSIPEEENYMETNLIRSTIVKLRKIEKTVEQQISLRKQEETFEDRHILTLINRIKTTRNINGTILKSNVLDYLKVIFDDYLTQKNDKLFFQNLYQKFKMKFDLLLEDFDELNRKYIQKEFDYKKLKKTRKIKMEHKNRYHKNIMKLLRFQLMQERKKKLMPIESSNPLIQELSKHQRIEKKQRRYSDNFFKISFLFSVHTSLYENVIRYFLPFPSKRQINIHFNNIIEKTKRYLFDLKNIRTTIRFLRKNNFIPLEPFDINLGVDAMSFEPYSKSFKSKKIKQYLDEDEISMYSSILSSFSYIEEQHCEEIISDSKMNKIQGFTNSIFAFVAMPINPIIKVFPLLFIPMETGKANNKILITMKKIIKACKQERINVKYISSDGDNTFDQEHIIEFNRYKDYLFDNTEIIFNTISEYNIWILSDLLHLLKIARNRMKHPIFLFNETNFITAEHVNNSLNLGVPLNDFSSCGKLKDSYPMAVFTLVNFLKLYEKRKTWLSAIYILPYALIETFLYNNKISTGLRLHLILIAFKFFEYFYFYRIKTEKISDKMKQGNKGVNFASEINIIRSMNTLIGLYHEIKKEVPFGLSRLGTQPIENLFGQIRSNSQKESNWTYLKNSIVVVSISKIFKENFGIKNKIRGRVSTGGARLFISDSNEEKVEIGHIDINNLMCSLNEKSCLILGMNDSEYEECLKSDFVYQFFLHLCIELSKNNEDEQPKYLQSKVVAARIMARLNNEKG